MRPFILQYEWQGYRVRGLIPDLVIPLAPEPDWPHGRKGKATADAWSLYGSKVRTGLLVMDNDVAADPDDLAAMTEAVQQLPADVHTAMVKNWPASTSRPDWIWSHRAGRLGAPEPTQDDSAAVVYFATGMTWLPGRLLDLAADQLPTWPFHAFDVGLSEVALAHDIPAHAVPACRPKHLHF